MDILTTNGLTKLYGLKRAVDGINMTVREGDIYGFVGLNGAGKTTVMRIITGLSKKSGGSFNLFGTPDSANLDSNRHKISSMVETPAIYLNMNGVDNLKMQCHIMRADFKVIPELLKLVGLDSKNMQHAKNYSLGMRQRLGIAMALVGDPSFMMLDEPTNGLDPEGIIEVRDLLKDLNAKRGITIMVSSHILTELSKLATTYGFINKGKLVKEISAAQIESINGHKVTIEVDNPDMALVALAKKVDTKRVGNKLEINSEVTISDIVHYLDTMQITVNSAITQKLDLENYFMDLIGGAK